MALWTGNIRGFTRGQAEDGLSAPEDEDTEGD